MTHPNPAECQTDCHLLADDRLHLPTLQNQSNGIACYKMAYVGCLAKPWLRHSVDKDRWWSPLLPFAQPYLAELCVVGLLLLVSLCVWLIKRFGLRFAVHTFKQLLRSGLNTV